MPTKFIVILGSLMSGLGKGVVTSSILKILDFYDLTAIPVKFDGYLNYDCGTMNPYRHGEVFVLDDKSEVDMDFGLYERFLNRSLTGDSSVTGGKLFSSVIKKERNGDYLGEDVQIIPHLTNEIMERVERLAKEKAPDVLLMEIGGTVGDIENSYMIEAMRQLSLKHDVLFVNLTYVPTLNVVGEQKTKPSQIGFKLLMQAGIVPDVVVCRSETPLQQKTKEKLALFSRLTPDRIIDDSDQDTLYGLPLHFMQQGLDRIIIGDLALEKASINEAKVAGWRERVGRIVNPSKTAEIAVVGKYTKLRDSYASVKEALVHAGAQLGAKVNIRWVEAEDLEAGEGSVAALLAGANGMIVTGGFGKRGTEGMINAIRVARETGMPYLGICLGMQLMVAEYARNVCMMEKANSTEFDPDTPYKVIDLIEEQRGIVMKGGTMRLGAQACALPLKESIAYRAYGNARISERHRHRYEFNNKYRRELEEKGLLVTGINEDEDLVEFVEWKTGFGIGTQSHPELKSRFEAPAPLFVSLVQAAAMGMTAAIKVPNPEAKAAQGQPA